MLDPPPGANHHPLPRRSACPMGMAAPMLLARWSLDWRHRQNRWATMMGTSPVRAARRPRVRLRWRAGALARAPLIPDHNRHERQRHHVEKPSKLPHHGRSLPLSSPARRRILPRCPAWHDLHGRDTRSCQCLVRSRSGHPAPARLRFRPTSQKPFHPSPSNAASVADHGMRRRSRPRRHHCHALATPVASHGMRLRQERSRVPWVARSRLRW